MPGRPRCESRSAISPAALSVNVTTRTRLGSTAPVATAYATRWVTTRVFPDPAPAWMTSGPRVIRTASAWAGSSPTSRSSGSVVVIARATPRRGPRRSGSASPGKWPLDPAIGHEPDHGDKDVQREGDIRDDERDDQGDRVEEGRH